MSHFINKSGQASCNYVVGYDGSIGLCVPECDRSKCSSNKANDHRAITIEVASDTFHPYAVTDAAFNALIKLLVDICQRNNIKQLRWKGDRNLIGRIEEQNMTVHRWFANKACPGDYLYSRHGLIAQMVNEELEDEDMTQEKFNEMMNNYIAALANQPATWEQQALIWAQNEGLLMGDEQGRLMAKKFMTRGEMVTVLQRLIDKLEKEG